MNFEFTDVCIHPRARFPLGRLVATPAVVQKVSAQALAEAVRRHVTGDWGDHLDDHDRAVNDDCLRSGGRLLSQYFHGDIRFWLITEADRSSTCVLLPEEY